MDGNTNLEKALADAVASVGTDIDILDLPTLASADKVMVVSGNKIGYMPVGLLAGSVLVETLSVDYGTTDSINVGFGGQAYCICFLGGTANAIEKLYLGNEWLESDGEETSMFCSRINSTFVRGKVNLVLDGSGILHVYGGLDSVIETLYIRLFYMGKY